MHTVSLFRSDETDDPVATLPILDNEDPKAVAADILESNFTRITEHRQKPTIAVVYDGETPVARFMRYPDGVREIPL